MSEWSSYRGLEYLTNMYYIALNNNRTHLDTSKHHDNTKTQQIQEHRHIIHTHPPSLSDRKTLEKTLLPYITTIHHKEHPTRLNRTWFHKQPFYKHRSTPHKQHHFNMLQPTHRQHNNVAEVKTIRYSQHTKPYPDPYSGTFPLYNHQYHHTPTNKL